MVTESPAGTAASILEAAERMAQLVGYSGLSFRDIATSVGIKSASVHYHFPSKGQLGAAIARRYTDRLVAQLSGLDARGVGSSEAFAAYVAVFRTTLEQDGRMCLCGMLAAETDMIPPEIRHEVRRFVDLNVQWIAGTLERTAEAARIGGAARDRARAILAALEGAMLVARGTGDIAIFDAIAAQFWSVGLLPRWSGA